MEVKSKITRRADYYPKIKRSVLLTTICWLSFAFLIIFTALLYSRVELLVALLASTLLMLTLFLAIYSIISITLTPLKVLSHVIAHVANEVNDVTPPNLNNDQYQSSGLKMMAQTIYDVSQTTPSPNIATNNELPLDTLPAGVITMTSQGKVTYANRDAPVSTADDGKITLRLLFDENNSLEAWLKDCEEKKITATNTWQRVASKLPDEPERKIYDVVAHYKKGASPEVILLCIDRTSRYAPDEESMDFIALAAHELRGPITVIHGYLDVLGDELDEVLSDEQRELIDRLVVSANRLNTYVGNILNVAHYERQKLPMPLMRDTLRGIFDSIRDDVQLRAETQLRLLTVNMSDDLPAVAANRSGLGEVLVNLIDNAIKYTGEGGVVQVEARVDGDFVACSVSDNGIGIPGNVIPQLFQRFYRSHRSRENVAGTGLGLYITRAIVQAHGGSIAVKSQEGKGATFTFTVPIYDTISDKLDPEGEIITGPHGWIRNHGMRRD